MDAKKALITGITGQDGSYLAELLLQKGYIVHGIIRRSSNFNTQRIDHIYQDPHNLHRNLILHYGDLNDGSSLNKLVRDIKPDEIYNLGAQSHVRVSFEIPEYTGEINALGTLRLLETIRETGVPTRFYQASTSEIYGETTDVPQNEETPFKPVSPYGIAKLYAYWSTIAYRKGYNLYACNGILFNHESPRRGENFLTRKITIGIAKILAGKEKKIYLGNLDAKRDWGYAPDYVHAMWLMLQQKEADDYVIATGETHTVREFIETAFKMVGIAIRWEGEGIHEKGIDTRTSNTLIEIDPYYFRPLEVHHLCGNSTKAKQKLGWEPTIKFADLVRIMVRADLERYNLGNRVV